MTCPRLHCPGCSGGQSLGDLAAAAAAMWIADELVAWVAERIWWIGATAAVCLALAVAVSMWLEAWHDRGQAWGHARGIYSRADVIGPEPVRVTAVTNGTARPAIAPQVVNFNFYGAASDQQAAVIRHALNRREEP